MLAEGLRLPKRQANLHIMGYSKRNKTDNKEKETKVSRQNLHLWEGTVKEENFLPTWKPAHEQGQEGLLKSQRRGSKRCAEGKPKGILQRDRCQSALPKLRCLFALRKEIIKIIAEINDKEIKEAGEEPRWRRSRTGTTLSPPQIHQEHLNVE